ncbi:coenzyme Q-binding protein COQ10-like protein A, mitochondrial [Platysternon megacephalum]|uniref:Coenzyme Q-binding protein COQ10-like protein A, mitochondrial n=1 Tax=Platysternon megacephalum TaxID=55544 RepID=A0A4D9E0F5_9SAUR|nr:coenzyme Q-binding protein COQ10-like protein A, mitochondrial [Platysternon megacephalum]
MGLSQRVSFRMKFPVDLGNQLLASSSVLPLVYNYLDFVDKNLSPHQSPVEEITSENQQFGNGGISCCLPVHELLGSDQLIHQPVFFHCFATVIQLSFPSRKLLY